MQIRVSTRSIVRLIVAGATLASIGCAASPVDPIFTNRAPSQASRHDDDPNNPPTEFCASGWVMGGGRWTCGDL